MKKVLLLLVAICCLLTSCNKMGSHSLDGTKWVNGDRFLEFKDGLAKLDGNVLSDFYYDQTATLNKDRIFITMVFHDFTSIIDNGRTIGEQNEEQKFIKVIEFE